VPADFSQLASLKRTAGGDCSGSGGGDLLQASPHFVSQSPLS
jgi:hypothetical protein